MNATQILTSLTVSPTLQITEIFVASIGLMIQSGNTVYAIRHAIKRPTAFNIALVVSMALYAFAFIPLLITTCFVAGDPPVRELFFRARLISITNTIHNILFSLSSFMYMVLVQLRFRVIHAIVRYSSIWDYVGLTVTSLVWVSSAFAFGVVYPIAKDYKTSDAISLQSTLIWTVYALILDNVISFVFMSKLFSARKRMLNVMKNNTQHINGLVSKVYKSLGLLMFASWMAICVVLIAAFVFVGSPSIRRLLYRIGYTFSCMEFSGAIVFMNAIPKMFVSSSEKKEKRHASVVMLTTSPVIQPSVLGNNPF